MSKKAQATKKEAKVPFSRKFGGFMTKATMGLGYKAGRGAYQIGTNVIAGAADAGREIKRGYDEAKSENE